MPWNASPNVMKRGAIWRISVTTTTEAEDAVAELMSSVFHQSACAYTDAQAHATKVAAFCETRPPKLDWLQATLRAGLRRIKSSGLDAGPGQITVRKIPRENWAESWKRHFKPMAIGDALLIKPGWSRRRPHRGQAVVVLDPGLAFGTGQHPTTEFCLRELVRTWERWQARRRVAVSDVEIRRQRCRHSRTLPPSFLDIGTGSGILAIAAAKLGYAPVHAFDFDPESIRVARANARVNRVQRKLRISRVDVTRLPRQSARRYDVVCANLVANLLIAERDRILTRLQPGGTLVVSGILNFEFREVAAAYESAGLRLIAQKTGKEWRSGTFTRPSSSADKKNKSAFPPAPARCRTRN